MGCEDRPIGERGVRERDGGERAKFVLACSDSDHPRRKGKRKTKVTTRQQRGPTGCQLTWLGVVLVTASPNNHNFLRVTEFLTRRIFLKYFYFKYVVDYYELNIVLLYLLKKLIYF